MAEKETVKSGGSVPEENKPSTERVTVTDGNSPTQNVHVLGPKDGVPKEAHGLPIPPGVRPDRVHAGSSRPESTDPNKK